MKRSLGWALITAMCTLAGCSGSEESGGAGAGGAGNPATGFTVTGDVLASGLPPGAKVMVIWSVSSSSPDYAAKFGEGKIEGTTFTVTFPGAPPPEALNAWGSGQVGVGLVIAVSADFELPDGIVQMNNTELEAELLAGNFRQMILWRSGAVQDPSWAGAFPDGAFSCGQCADETEGFDSIVPASCADLSLLPPGVDAQCNWT